MRNSGKTVWCRLCDRKPPENGMFPGDNQIRVTSSARANLFLILDGVDGVDHGSPETLALQLPTPTMVVPPGEQTASFITAGCCPVASCSFPVPTTIWLAMR